MPDFSSYPKMLYHPNAQPAVVSDDFAWTGPGLPPIGWQAPPGQPATLPPVRVTNEDQEAYYVSRGYNPGTDEDLKAWEQRVVAPKPPGFMQQQYPYFDENGRYVEDPNKTAPPDLNYPKWVTTPSGEQKLARSAEEERLLCPPPAPTGVEAECMALIMAAAGSDVVSPVFDRGDDAMEYLDRKDLDPEQVEMVELFTQAQSLGIKIDRRWKRATLQAEIDKALAA